MLHRPVVPLLLLVIGPAGAAFFGCSTPSFTTVTLYDSPHAFVRLEVDRTLSTGSGHAHPGSVSEEDLTAVLQGIKIREPVFRLPGYDDLGKPRLREAFTAKEVAWLAPLLARALRTATPQELVTFYMSRDLGGSVREVTSGGVFLEDGATLHLLLANSHSRTHFSPDPGVADTTDERLTPLRPLAPQQGKLLFEPAEAWIQNDREWLSRLFAPNRRELRIRLQSLARGPAGRSTTGEPAANGAPNGATAGQ